jgi:hypothetical protein
MQAVRQAWSKNPKEQEWSLEEEGAMGLVIQEGRCEIDQLQSLAICIL